MKILVKGKSVKDSGKTIRLLEDFINVTKRWIDVMEGKASLEELKQALVPKKEEEEVKVEAKSKPKHTKSRGRRRRKT